MDTKNEDTMVRQIEKNLSNNINDNLFITGRIFDQEPSNQEYPLVSTEHLDKTVPTISRAEYIRQAREACLRQLSSSQVYSKPYDVNYMLPETIESEPQQNSKKAKVWDIFKEGDRTAEITGDVDSPQEIASFRSLIIRTICAIVLFISIFIIDKFNLKIGDLTGNTIQEYVTGNDSLQSLEDIVVTWLK